LNVINNSTTFTSALEKGDVIRIPIAHGDGNYFAEPETIKELEDGNRIIFKYCNDKGEIITDANPNGSLKNIAGIINKNGNVLGMMPHPERYSDQMLGCDDGIKIFESIISNINL
jgi:phosphoribosylformylglycinamidine synthase